MFALIYVFSLFAVVLASESSSNKSDFKCKNGTAYHNVVLSTYYCPWSTSESNRKDVRGIIARPIQEYVDNGGKFVTVAGNLDGIPYATKVCIEELNEYFGMRIPLEIRDDFYMGREIIPDYSRLDICVRNPDDLIDSFFNDRYVTIYVQCNYSKEQQSCI